MTNVEAMQKLFPECPICHSKEGYKLSHFYPNVQCKSCKSEWRLYEYGMELTWTSQTGWIRELLNRKYALKFWKSLKKPIGKQVIHRIFAPMDCIGGAPDHEKPTKGYIIFESEKTIVYYSLEEKNNNKVRIRIPIDGIKQALITTKITPLVDKKFLMVSYEDSYGLSHTLFFDFHNDEKVVKELIELLHYSKNKRTEKAPEQEIQKLVHEKPKTKGEKQVADYLKELGLFWVYEFPIFVYDEENRPRVWTPDFYIPKLGMYIEVCGSKDFDYKYRENIYRKNGYHVIFVHFYKEQRKWKNYLVKRIMEIEELRHSEVMNMINSALR